MLLFRVVGTKAANVIALCTNTNPSFRRYIATYNTEQQHQHQQQNDEEPRTIVTSLTHMLQSATTPTATTAHLSAAAAAAEAVYFLSHNGAMNHAGFVLGGAVPALARILTVSAEEDEDEYKGYERK